MENSIHYSLLCVKSCFTFSDIEELITELIKCFNLTKIERKHNILALVM